jgi:hypothetical protein
VGHSVRPAPGRISDRGLFAPTDANDHSEVMEALANGNITVEDLITGRISVSPRFRPHGDQQLAEQQVVRLCT